MCVTTQAPSGGSFTVPSSRWHSYVSLQIRPLETIKTNFALKQFTSSSIN